MKNICLLPVLTVLTACTGHTDMQQRLAFVMTCNRADTVFSARWLPIVDSLASYYDRHGSPNDRMMAHYLQGRVHHDMGEAPQAVDCYLEAAACADTAASDCDYRTLGCIYSQMAGVFHQQLLLSNEIEARKRSHYYGLAAGDTLGAISSIDLMAGTVL